MTGERDDVTPSRWPEAEPQDGPALAPPSAESEPEPEPGEVDEQSDELVVRPFLLTGGRTRPTRDDLHIETLIHAGPGARAPELRFEARQIVELTRTATSMAELAAALRVPLGVARVLVSDLVADGTVSVMQRETLSIQLIERIRDRVRAL